MKPVGLSPLLSLIGASAQLRAGLWPSCAVVVRLLDRVHFTVHAGDCVVVHHHDPAAARVLLAALAGHPVLRARHLLSGERICPPWLRIRRTAIRRDAMAAILAGWREVYGPAPASQRQATESAIVPDPCSLPVLHLLRASRDGCVTRDEWRQWRNWARRERSRGGAVVMVARPHEVPPLPHGGPRAQAHEGAPPDSLWTGTRGVRELLLQHGQLRYLREWH